MARFSIVLHDAPRNLAAMRRKNAAHGVSRG